MKIIFERKPWKFLSQLDRKEKSRVDRYLDLLSRYGFELTEQYLKRVMDGVWELRPGQIRLFMVRESSSLLVILAIRKDSKKVRNKTINFLKSRARGSLNEKK